MSMLSCAWLSSARGSTPIAPSSLADRPSAVPHIRCPSGNLHRTGLAGRPMEAALAEVAVPIACRSRWAGGLRLDRVGVDVLEELEATVAVCRLPSGVWRLASGVWSMAMLAWLPSRPTAVSVHSPLTVSRPRTVKPRSVKKAIVASRSRTAMPTFSSLMGMPCTLPSQDDSLRSLGCRSRSARAQEHVARSSSRQSDTRQHGAGPSRRSGKRLASRADTAPARVLRDHPCRHRVPDAGRRRDRKA
jgi:hypothetical protein